MEQGYCGECGKALFGTLAGQRVFCGFCNKGVSIVSKAHAPTFADSLALTAQEQMVRDMGDRLPDFTTMWKIINRGVAAAGASFGSVAALLPSQPSGPSFADIEASMGRPATMGDLVKCIEGVLTECEDDEGAPLPDAREALTLARGLAERHESLVAQNASLRNGLDGMTRVVVAVGDALKPIESIFSRGTKSPEAVAMLVAAVYDRRPFRMPEHVRAAYAEAAAASFGVTPEAVRARKGRRKVVAALDKSPFMLGEWVRCIDGQYAGLVGRVESIEPGPCVSVEIANKEADWRLLFYGSDALVDWRRCQPPFPRNETRTIGVDVVPYPDDNP